MTKKKILTLAMTLSMVAILAIGGTIAYFTDTDNETNIFTVGDVKIDLYENFNQNSKLVPTTGKDDEGNIINAVKKEVYVLNEGSEDAYVRVHIAIPALLDDGADTFDASANILHFNYEEQNVGVDKWDWSKSTGAPYTGDWNYYETSIDNIDYNVYVVTYEKALAHYESTVNAIHQVYLDADVTNQDIEELKKGTKDADGNEVTEALGDNWKILVVAEAAQAEGFDNAYDALNEAFGVPGSEGYVINWDEGTDVDNDAIA